MKIVAFIIDFIVLGGLVFGMYALMGDTYSNGNILTRTLLMAGVGAVWGFLRAIYRQWLLPKEEDENQE